MFIIHLHLFRVRIFQAEGAQLLQELPLPNIVDIKFSPRGTYLSTWERPGALNSFFSRAHGSHLSTSPSET